MENSSNSKHFLAGRCALTFLLIFIFIFSFLGSSFPAKAFQDGDTFNAITYVKEGNDYATQVLGIPWDMSDYSQVSTYMNFSGMNVIMSDLTVENGVFSGRSLTRQASFSALFPGYDNALYIGKIGHNYPITASKYRCAYVAAKVDTQPSNEWDQMFFFWYANEKLNGPSGTHGAANYKLYDSLSNPNPRWKLIKLDLSQINPPLITGWNQAPNGQWQGLHIAPSIQPTTWAIDWIRLTDCDKTGHTITIDWRGSTPVSISVKPEGTNREILVETGVTTHNYAFDIQGLQAGRYTYYVRDGSTELSSGDFEVVGTPVITFVKPSYTSGVDYATQAGQPWDMSPASVTNVECMSYNFDNGILNTTTIPGSQQTGDCYGGGYGNPAIVLNTPIPIDTTQYRYMTFRMKIEGPWQNVPLGMIARWIWYLQGTSGYPGNRCWLISFGVPTDVGWHTYTMDLWDPHQGGVDDSSIAECPPQPWAWRNASPALEVRIKPNENILSSNMIQQLDWVTLTKPETVRKGTVFNVKLNTSKEVNPNQVTLYYTTDRSNPKMYPMGIASSNLARAYPWLLPNQFIYLPLIKNGLPGPMQFNWDTTFVAAGDYYICGIANDSYNAVPYCSDVPVTVTQ